MKKYIVSGSPLIGDAVSDEFITIEILAEDGSEAFKVAKEQHPNVWFFSSIPARDTIQKGVRKMETFEVNAHTFKLPNPSTEEDLEGRWNTVLNFGDQVLLAGYYYNGTGPSYFGAVYEHLDNDLSCEGEIGLKGVSDLQFSDEGHAIQWAIQEALK